VLVLGDDLALCPCPDTGRLVAGAVAGRLVPGLGRPTGHHDLHGALGALQDVDGLLVADV
jgi:hypothetical protein